MIFVKSDIEYIKGYQNAETISMPRTGFLSLHALMTTISEFYDPDLESKYGIVGIEIEIIE